MMKAIVLLTCAVAIAASPALGAASCKESKHLVGPCFSVHGRLQGGNGTPWARIWPIGTKRMLGVLDGEGEAESDNVIPVGPASFNLMNVAVYGNFRVCPLTKSRPGWMQMVCIAGASKLVAVK